MDYDDFLKRIGGLGRWQLTNISILWMAVVLKGVAFMTYVLVFGKPDKYRCLVQGCEGSGSKGQDMFNSSIVGRAVLPPEGKLVLCIGCLLK